MHLNNMNRRNLFICIWIFEIDMQHYYILNIFTVTKSCSDIGKIKTVYDTVVFIHMWQIFIITWCKTS